MTGTRVLIILLAIGIGACGQRKMPNLKISFGDLETGNAFLYDTRKLTTDTVTIRNGILEYHKAMSGPGVYYLVVENYNEWQNPLKLVLSAEPTALKFDSLRPVRNTNNIFDLNPNQPVFQLDPHRNSVYYSFLKEWATFFNAIQRYTPKENEPDTSLQRRKDLFMDFLKSSESAVLENSNTLVAAIIVDHLLNDNLLPLEKTQQLYAALSPEVKNHDYTAAVKTEAGFKAGSKAPAFEVTDKNGKTFNLEDISGRKVLLHFWSSTCAPCINEAPKLVRLQDQYQNKNLVIINISLDINKTRWLKGISRAGIGDMINVCDFKGLRGEIVQAYNIRAIPAYYLIDENDNIVCKGTINDIVRRL